MFTKLSVALVATLAFIAQASHHHGSPHYAHEKRHGKIYGRASNQTLSTGASTTPTVPLTTGPSSTGGKSPVETGEHVLTYTLGSGSSTTVVTTTIKETTTATNVHTVYATSGSEGSPTGGSEGSSEPTATIYSTSTSTETKTLVPATSGLGNSPIGASGSGKCPVQVTVTETGPAVVSSHIPWRTVFYGKQSADLPSPRL